MAGSVTYTERTFATVKLLKGEWTSNTTGDVSGTESSYVYDGAVCALTTVPSGVAQPANLYDVTCLCDNDQDVLCGTGLDRDNASTEHIVASLGAVSASKLTLTIANAGDTKQGTAYIWIR